MTRPSTAIAATGRSRMSLRDLVTIAFLLAGIPLIALGLSRVRLENDVEDWLPAADSDGRILRWHHEHFDSQERFLCTWDSSSLGDPRVDQLARELAFPPDQSGLRQGRFAEIARVMTPGDLLDRMMANQVAPEQAVKRIVGVAVGRGFLKVRLTPAGRADFAASAQAILQRLDSVSGAEIIRAVPSSSSGNDSAGEESPPDGPISEAGPPLDIPPHDFQLRWKGMTPADPRAAEIVAALNSAEVRGKRVVERAFFAPGAPAAVTVVLTANGSKHVSETIAIVNEAASRVGIPLEELHFGGGPIGRSRLNREALKAVWNEDYPAWNLFKRSPVLLSVLVGMLVALASLGSLRATFIVLFASIYVAAATVAAVPLLGDSLNMVLIVMPNLLFVVTMSGAIHLVNYWQTAARRDRASAVREAVRSAAMPCALASVTTAIGTASLLSSPLSPIREFGLYSTGGILASMAMVLRGVPALMALAIGPPADRGKGRTELWRRLGHWAARFAGWIQVATALLAVYAIGGLVHFRTEAKVIRYFPDHLRIIQDYEFFEASLAGVVNVDVAMHFAMPDDEGTGNRATFTGDIGERLELVRRAEDALRQVAGVTGTLSVADFRRPLTPPGAGAPLAVRMFYRTGMKRLHGEIFERQDSRVEDVANEGEAGSHQPAAALAAIVHTPLHVNEAGEPVDLHLGDEAWRIRVQCTVLEDVDYDTLLSAIRDRLETVAAGEPGVDFLITGSVPLFLRAQQALLKSLFLSFGAALALITVVMILFVRSIPGGLIAMLPNVVPVLLTFGGLSWAEVPIDIGTMMTASIALGIAIDGTLHLITWFQKCQASGGSRDDAIGEAMAHCGPPLSQTAIVIALGMLMLTGADLRLISRFGDVMAILVVTALFADVVFLPALLATSLGRLVRPGKKSEQD